MNQRSRSLLLERLARCAEDLSAVRLAVLFGSVARRPGIAERARDIDVGVLLDQAKSGCRREVERVLGRAAGRPFDLVILDQAPPLLRFEIARDGVLLFEREDHLWADFRARAMIDWWDWAPTARAIHAASARRLKERLGHGSP